MVVEVNSRSKTLYKVQLYLLKVIHMVMAFICLLNSTLSYFDIDIPLLSYIASNSILTKTQVSDFSLISKHLKNLKEI